MIFYALLWESDGVFVLEKLISVRKIAENSPF